MQNVLKVFKAVSDQTGLRIINLLLERECSVCECLTQLVRSVLDGNELAALDRERLKTAVREGPCKERLRNLGLERQFEPKITSFLCRRCSSADLASI